ncbi:MAG: hypothetical protein L0I33_05125 [Acetobacter sp.]|nr:hypothetical protein [Acetobacter sp.]
MNQHDSNTSARTPLSQIQAIRRILGLWHAQAPRLIIGIVLALLALCLGLALMQTAGLRVAGAVVGQVLITTA